MVDEQECEKDGLTFKIHVILLYLICAITYSLVAFHRSLPAILSKEMTFEFGVDVSSLTSFSSMCYWAYALMQPFGGLFADIIDPRYLIGLASILSGVGSMIISVSKKLSFAVVGRLIVGIGTGPIIIPIIKLLTRRIPEEDFPLYNGLMASFGGMGSILAQTPLKEFSSIYGWRISFLCISGLSFLLGFLVILIVRKDPVCFGYPMIAKKPLNYDMEFSIREEFGILIKNLAIISKIPTFWLLSIQSMLHGGCLNNVLGLWGGPYIRDVFVGYDEAKVLTWISVSIIIGCVAMPILSKLCHTKKWIMFSNSILSFTMCTIIYFYDTKLSQSTLSFIFFIFGITNGSFPSLRGPCINDVCEPSFTGSMHGCANFFSYFGGALYQSFTGEMISKYHPVNQKYSHNAYMNSLWIIVTASSFISMFPPLFLYMKKSPDDSSHSLDDEQKV